MKRRSIPAIIFLTLIANAVTSHRAQAVWFYIEPGIGLGQFRSANAFFGGNTPDSPSWGLGANLTLALSLTGDSFPFAIHLGVITRLSTGSTGSGYISMLVPYPAVRLQFSPIFLSAGVSPLVWQRENADPGILPITAVSGAFAILGEFGALWPVGSNFALGGVIATQFVMVSGAMSPAPALDFGVLMRFYLGSPSSKEDREKGEFQGWRYPFGFEKQ